MWVYIWFYFAWGMNYFRFSFYERTKTEKVEYASSDFKRFLDEYIHSLNYSFKSVNRDTAWYTNAYQQEESWRKLSVEKEVAGYYRNLPEQYGLVKPPSWLIPKNMLFSKGMSMVGVSGYMGPFFAEFNLNRELLNIEYPFTYAHELAHRLGIASEAEANLYAFLTTTCSEIPEVRLSGYFSLLGYVMSNARRLLSAEEYQEILGRLPAEILVIYNQHIQYWREKYNPWIGKIQSCLYNAYLKGNKINNGTKNYSEVIGLLMALRK